MNNMEYICISDFVKIKEKKSNFSNIIGYRLRNMITLFFRYLYNLNLNYIEFDGF